MGHLLHGLRLGLVVLAFSSLAGCALVPKSRLDQAQAFNRELQQKNQQLAAELDQARLQAQDLAGRSLELENKLSGQDELLANYQDRMNSHQSEREQLQQLYDDAISRLKAQPANLSPELRSRLTDFARRHPEFVEVDPATGISKFRSDVLFATGEADLSPEGQRVLQEFAAIFRGESAKQLRLMVVGHADDRPIVRNATASRHPTNWHLSVHRAVAVEQFLQKSGIEPERMGVAGYGEHQPAVANAKDTRQRNRRVEIYVMSPDAPIVGRSDARRAY
jgi:chemotaxis protein MotB